METKTEYKTLNNTDYSSDYDEIFENNGLKPNE